MCWPQRDYIVPRIPECLSRRRNWVPPSPTSECVSPPPGSKGGEDQNSFAGVGVGRPNSDDWIESLALCILCGAGCTYNVHKSRRAALKFLCPASRWLIFLLHFLALSKVLKKVYGPSCAYAWVSKIFGCYFVLLFPREGTPLFVLCLVQIQMEKFKLNCLFCFIFTKEIIIQN